MNDFRCMLYVIDLFANNIDKALLPVLERPEK